ncbi:PREDICTED: nodulin-26-like [Ipomoea nil]|uniref:nodulin-26-like n=1 Tax=Ipomoea nil TaxID=35883 RepID=UPI000901AC68|nr:PREDICTED: nodulin-26-like [Ipomoea nil]
MKSVTSRIIPNPNLCTKSTTCYYKTLDIYQHLQVQSKRMSSIDSNVSGFSPKNKFGEFSIMEEETKHKHVFHSREFPREASAFISAFQKIVAELVGTYIFIFVGCGSALVDREKELTMVGIALAWGLPLMALIYTLGHVSGAHFNPAVTIAFGTSGRLPLLQVPMYVVCQLLGSTLACLTLKALFNRQNDIKPTLTQYNTPTTDLEAITWEFLMTFILMFVICGAASDDRANKEVAGVAIGVTLLFEVLVAGPITGASMNPARSIGPAVVSGVYKNQWVFVVAPIVGAMAATLVYSLLRPTKNAVHSEETTKSVVYNDLYSHSQVV